MNSLWEQEKRIFKDSFPQLRAYSFNNENIYIFDELKWSVLFDLTTTKKFKKEDIEIVFEFAFKSKDYHREVRSGGTKGRTSIERFFNIFIGKLCEIGTCEHFIKNKIELKNYVDYKVRNYGEWDDCDIITKNNKKISVKGSKYYSNMLLLEKKDYNQNGELIYNIGTNKISNFDYFAYIRVAPIKYNRIIFKGYGKDYVQKTDNLELELSNFVKSFDWVYEEPFIIEKELFVDTNIKNDYCIEKSNLVRFDKEGNVLLKLSKKRNTNEDILKYIEKMYNSTGFKLDATNYYFPLKYMKRLSTIKEKILENN